MTSNTVKMLLADNALSARLTAAAGAKTLVYCSEGSPEGFDQAIGRTALAARPAEGLRLQSALLEGR